tara:strand:+ start:549 stop:839 length:291 start_codon:yes stop_codon:yes gene_type:complete
MVLDPRFSRRIEEVHQVFSQHGMQPDSPPLLDLHLELKVGEIGGRVGHEAHDSEGLFVIQKAADYHGPCGVLGASGQAHTGGQKKAGHPRAARFRI